MKNRYLRWSAGLALMLFALGVAADAPEISSWYNSDATRTELAAGVAEWKLNARRDGLSAAFDAIAGRVEDLRLQTMPATPDREAIDKFLNLMNDAREQRQSAETSCGKQLDVSSKTDVGEVARNLRAPECAGIFRNPFSVTNMAMRPGVTVSEDELDFSQGDESEVSKSLVRYATYTSAILANANLYRMAATSAIIHAARGRWDAFMTNVVHDQFVWETLLNGWLGRHSETFAGTLSRPPTTQVRVGHPLPVMLYSDDGGTQFKPRIGLELLGWRNLDAERGYEPAWGLSAIALLPGSSDEDAGWGVVYTRKRLSFGVAWREEDDEDDIFTIVLGVNFADFFGNDATGFGDAVDRKLTAIRADVEQSLLP